MIDTRAGQALDGTRAESFWRHRNDSGWLDFWLLLMKYNPNYVKAVRYRFKNNLALGIPHQKRYKPHKSRYSQNTEIVRILVRKNTSLVRKNTPLVRVRVGVRVRYVLYPYIIRILVVFSFPSWNAYVFNWNIVEKQSKKVALRWMPLKAFGMDQNPGQTYMTAKTIPKQLSFKPAVGMSTDPSLACSKLNWGNTSCNDQQLKSATWFIVGASGTNTSSTISSLVLKWDVGMLAKLWTIIVINIAWTDWLLKGCWEPQL